MDEQSIFLAALACSESERERFLEERCGKNTELRSRIAELLRQHSGAGSFLEVPAIASRSASVSQSVIAEFEKVLEDVPHVELRSTEASPVEKLNSSEPPVVPPSEKLQIHGEIGRGGMGAIIKCRDKDIGRDIALKVLLQANSNDPQCIRRFIEEAQINGQLQHPGIVPVHDIGRLPDGRPFFTMKLVKGRTLSEILNDRVGGPADESDLLSIFIQVCQTMGYAHSRGVIHRDIKPSNIMVGSFGEVQVMDWGLAKVLHAGVEEERRMRAVRETTVVQTQRNDMSKSDDTGPNCLWETRGGSIMGTVEYMAPEQARGHTDELDERTDVFALGAILTQILTGIPPYRGASWRELLRKAAAADLTDCLERIAKCEANDDLKQIAKACLAIDPASRPCNASAVAERLVTYERKLEQEARNAEIQRKENELRMVEQQRRQKRFALSTGFAIVALIAATIFAGVFRNLANEKAELFRVAESRRHLAQSSRLVAEASLIQEEFPATAARLAGKALSDDNADLSAIAPLMQSIQQLSEAGTLVKSDFEPVIDMRMMRHHLLAVCENGLRIWQSKSDEQFIPISTALSDEIVEIKADRPGQRFVSNGDRVISWKLSLNRIEPHVLSQERAEKIGISDNGQWGAALFRNKSNNGSDRHDTSNSQIPSSLIRIWNLAEPEISAVVSVDKPVTPETLAVSSDGRWVALRDLESEKVTMWDLQVDETLTYEAAVEGIWSLLEFSPNSRLLLARASKRLCVWDIKSIENDPLTHRREIPCRGPFARISSDSKSVYTISDSSIFQSDLIDPTIEPIRLLTPDTFFGKISMTPDCKTIFASDCAGTSWFIQDLDAVVAGTESAVTRKNELQWKHLELSADGHFGVMVSADNTIRVRKTKDFGQSRFVLNGPRSTKFAPIATSSDGRWIASSIANGGIQLWKTFQPSHGTFQPVELPTNCIVRELGFSPDDKWLVAGLENGTTKIWDLRADHPGNPLILGSPSKLDCQSVFAFTPDSRLLATSHADHKIRLWNLSDEGTFDRPFVELQGNVDAILAMLITPDGRWLAASDSAHKRQAIVLWDLKAPNVNNSMIILGTSVAPVFSMATNASGDTLVAGCGDVVRIWDLSSRSNDIADSMRELSPVDQDMEEAIWRVELSPNGRWVFASRFNTTAQLWDLETNPVKPRHVFTHGVRDSLVTPDGRWLVLCKVGPYLQLIDMTAQHPERTVRMLNCRGDTLCQLAASSDSQWLVTSSKEGRIRRWHFDIDALLLEAKKLVGSELTDAERNLFESNQ